MKNLYVASCDKNGGIYRYEFGGKLALKEKTKFEYPMYLAADKGRMYVLLRKAFENGESGMLSLDIAADGRLQNPSEIASTRGEIACHICADGADVYAANYISGSVVKFGGKCDIHKGKGVNPNRQDKAHTHFVCFSPDKQYVCATDLGLDSIYFYDRNLNPVSRASVPEGCGARHLVFSNDGRYIYCVNELISSVSVFEYTGGRARLTATCPALPKDFCGENTAAAIRIYKNYLYVSNRGADNVAVFDISNVIPKFIKYIKVGAHPRDIFIEDGILISCDMNDNKVTFYNAESGKKLKEEITGIKSPLCALVI